MIYVETINCDGNKEEYEYADVEELSNLWYSDDSIDMFQYPMLDDELTYANVDSFEVDGDTFEDVMRYIESRYDFEY